MENRIRFNTSRKLSTVERVGHKEVWPGDIGGHVFFAQANVLHPGGKVVVVAAVLGSLAGVGEDVVGEAEPHCGHALNLHLATPK